MSSDQGRFSVYSSSDHSAWLWVVTIFCVVFATGLVLFRIKDRINTYFFDDFFVTLTFISLIAHSSLLMAALRLGLGRSPASSSPANISRASRLVFVARIILWLALGLSKCSIFLTVRRTVMRRQSLLCDAGIAIVSVWTFVAIIAVNGGCVADQTIFPSSSSCPGLKARLITIVAMDVLSEVYLFAVACYLFRSLHMQLGKKLQVGIGFGFRLGNIPLSIGYLIVYLTFVDHGIPSIGYIPVGVVQEFSVTYSLFSSIATSLARFAKEFHTFGASVVDTTSSHGGRRRTSSGWLPGSSWRKSGSKNSTTDTEGANSSGTSDRDGIELSRQTKTEHKLQISSKGEEVRKIRSKASMVESDNSQTGIMKEQAFSVDFEISNAGPAGPA